ncbi:transcriptional regulator [Nonomuraea sp. PA05]|uniref:transcriptional regulator n=1 Tax=Nonomuraea sp. PA05 TaxID=2604466 RepID=UPI0011D84565|nr:transcriptional regulator [Nonomuraea sp. PA05]TYB64865.1 transcriptional regulator [Nonomuraea sp. PA05]
MTVRSPADLLVLHAVRLIGFGQTAAIAQRFGLDPGETKELLLDAEAYGWVEHVAFAGDSGWTLTDRGRAEDERRLAAELDRAGGGDEVRDVHRAFLPLNALLLRACTDWQLRPAPGDRLAVNDHSDQVWDSRVVSELAGVDRALRPLADRLGSVLARFRGYDARFSAALARVRGGEGSWVDRTDVDSCHRVWFELHEDLIATLGLDRRTEA